MIEKLLRSLATLLLGGFLILTGFDFAVAESAETAVSVGQDEPQATAGPLPATRVERLKKQRRDRVDQSEPPVQNIAEKYLKGFDRRGSQSIDDASFWGFYPRVDWIARGSGAAIGVRYWNPEAIGPMDLMGSAFYSWRRYQHYDFQTGLIPNRGRRIPSRSFAEEQIEKLAGVEQGRFERFKLYANFRFRDRTDESFYGTGPDSKKEDRSRYRVKDSLVEAVAGFQFTRRTAWTFKFGSLNHTLRRGRSSPSLEEVHPIRDLPGVLLTPRYIRIHNSFLLDYRDDPGVPHRGFLIAFGWQRFDNRNTGDLFNFNQFAADVRGFIPLGANQRVIALRGFFVNSDADSGNRVPFFLQPSLGGGESLRGYDPFRFQGDKLLLIQGEYRWEASPRFEFALFGDTGSVANQGERISKNKLKSNWGIGFRFKSSRSTLFRLDQAFSNEGPRTQFRFSAVF
jgi:hypothetical protein